MNARRAATAAVCACACGVACLAAWSALPDDPPAPTGDVGLAEPRRQLVRPAARRRALRPGARVGDGIAAEAEAALGHLGAAAHELEQHVPPPAAPGAGSPDGIRTVAGAQDAVGAERTTQSRGRLADGQREGLWIEIDEDGGRSETEYHLGKPSGRTASWRADGSVRFVGTYTAGELTGTWSAWHPSGHLVSSRFYVAGKVTGPVCEYHPNGVLARESFYEDGKDVAPTTGWYDDGAIEYVVPYADGKREGEAVWYHPNGAVAARGTYENDVLHGTYRTFDAGGAETGVETWDHGVRVGTAGPGAHDAPGSGLRPAEGDGSR